jgi:hypothetical protein
LNRHSKLLGNDPQEADGQVERGQRVFCSNRGQRGGCGRTSSIFLADVLPRHTMSAPWLWKFLLALLAGDSVKRAAQNIPFALETLYGLRRKMRRVLDGIRARLFREAPPPASGQEDALLQTVEHLKEVFAGSDCALKQYQLGFQVGFLG